MSKSYRPNSLKKLWYRVKQTGTAVGNAREIPFEQRTQQEVQKEDMCDTPPPPYTESPSNNDSKNPAPGRNSTSYPLLSEFAFARMDSQFLCDSFFFVCLMEIMAVTFSTDFVRLKAILAEINPAWAGLSHLQEPSLLFHISMKPVVTELTALVRNLEAAIAGNRWLFIHENDKELVRKWVLLPVQARGMNLDYVLEVLGRYECTEGHGVKGCHVARKTLVDYWMPLSPRDLPKDETTMPNLGDTLASHALLLHSLRLDEKTKLLFEESVNTCWKGKGLEGLQTSKEMQEESLASEKCCWWPLSDGYMDLAKALRGLGPRSGMDDPFEPSRTRLRERRKLCRTLTGN